MDRMKEAEAREVIRWEAEQYVPFDMENVQLDFQILDPEGDGLQMSVLLVAAKRELVDQRVALLKDAGLDPTVVDVDAFALYNAFEYNYPDAMRGTVALVNVGHEISTVNVLQDGAPVLTRDVPFGSRRLREDLRRLHGLTADEAEGVIQGVAEDSEKYLASLVEGAQELGVGIERAVAFLSIGDGAGDALGKIYLCGGGARVPGLAQTIADRMRVRTEVVNPFQRLTVRPDVASLFAVDELGAMLTLPIGLALRSAN
jgi:type IV pilus assembly protein PilM